MLILKRLLALLFFLLGMVSTLYFLKFRDFTRTHIPIVLPNNDHPISITQTKKSDRLLIFSDSKSLYLISSNNAEILDTLKIDKEIYLGYTPDVGPWGYVSGYYEEAIRYIFDIEGDKIVISSVHTGLLENINKSNWKELNGTYHDKVSGKTICLSIDIEYGTCFLYLELLRIDGHLYYLVNSYSNWIKISENTSATWVYEASSYRVYKKSDVYVVKTN